MAKKENWNCWSCWNPKTCGWGLIIIGAVWFVSEQGWIPLNVSIWPIILILIGLYFLLSRK